MDEEVNEKNHLTSKQNGVHFMLTFFNFAVSSLTIREISEISIDRMHSVCVCDDRKPWQQCFALRWVARYVAHSIHAKKTYWHNFCTAKPMKFKKKIAKRYRILVISIKECFVFRSQCAGQNVGHALCKHLKMSKLTFISSSEYLHAICATKIFSGKWWAEASFGVRFHESGINSMLCWSCTLTAFVNETGTQQSSQKIRDFHSMASLHTRTNVIKWVCNISVSGQFFCASSHCPGIHWMMVVTLLLLFFFCSFWFVCFPSKTFDWDYIDLQWQLQLKFQIGKIQFVCNMASIIYPNHLDAQPLILSFVSWQKCAHWMNRCNNNIMLNIMLVFLLIIWFSNWIECY